MAIEGLVTPPDNSVTTAKLVDDAVTYAKIQNVSATDMLLGRSTAGAGNVEEIACTAAGRALLDDANAAAQLVTLGAAALASPTFTGTPAAPTAAGGTNTTQIATTAFVTTAVAGATPTGIAANQFATNGFVVGEGMPGVVLAYRIPVSNASGDYQITVPAGVTFAFVDALFQKTGGAGGAGDSFALKFGGTNGTIDGNVADNAIARLASFDDTWPTVSTGDHITITATKVTNVEGWFTVLVMKA